LVFIVGYPVVVYRLKHDTDFWGPHRKSLMDFYIRDYQWIGWPGWIALLSGPLLVILDLTHMHTGFWQVWLILWFGGAMACILLASCGARWITPKETEQQYLATVHQEASMRYLAVYLRQRDVGLA